MLRDRAAADERIDDELARVGESVDHSVQASRGGRCCRRPAGRRGRVCSGRCAPRRPAGSPRRWRLSAGPAACSTCAGVAQAAADHRGDRPVRERRPAGRVEREVAARRDAAHERQPGVLRGDLHDRGLLRAGDDDELAAGAQRVRRPPSPTGRELLVLRGVHVDVPGHDAAVAVQAREPLALRARGRGAAPTAGRSRRRRRAR